jgi:NADPH-dependent glutamate synthase beta subunit-like oxidoreductase/ferredoxin
MVVKEMYHRVDPEFKHKLLEVVTGETLKLCYQCGTCTATCPVGHFVDVYRPNKILHLANLGIRNVPYGNAVFLCSACTSCTKRCPQGVKVHNVMHALKELSVADGHGEEFINGKFEEIIASLREEIPFPVTYAWVCLSPSDDKVGRSKFDNLVVDVLHRLLPDRQKRVAPLIRTHLQKVAIIGSGPAGLMAAWELNRMGFPVTVFEALSVAGGMLIAGIPEYRLPKDVVLAEVERIKNLGVNIKTNTTVDKKFFDSLLKGDEYKATFIATGAPANRKLRIEGEDLPGVVSALELLRRYNLQGKTTVGKRVVVIGGGNVAMDAARTALRSGAESVQLFCLESRKEMPGHEWEIEDAAREGVVLNPSWGPRKMSGDGKKVTGVEFVRCTSVFDDKGKFNPSFDESTIKNIEADTVISAIGQSTDFSFMGKEISTARNTITVDPLTMAANLPGVFAGGDAVSGTASVIEAIVAGRTAALSIGKYLDSKK